VDDLAWLAERSDGLGVDRFDGGFGEPDGDAALPGGDAAEDAGPSTREKPLCAR
jgi:hypothetical protein